MSLSVCSEPCWEAVCDKCGEGDNSEYGGSFHHALKSEALAALRDQDWVVSADEEQVLCSDCYEELVGQLPCPHGGRCAGHRMQCGQCPTPADVFARLGTEGTG